MNKTVLNRLRELREKGVVPASRFSASTRHVLEPLFATGVLSKEASRGGYVIRLNANDAIDAFISRNFPSEGTHRLVAETNRAQSILVHRDSKKGNTSQTAFVVMRGFSECRLYQHDRTMNAASLTRRYGACALKVDKEHLWSFDGIIALVENLEVFWHIEHVMDVDLAIYLAGRISNKIITWFSSNAMQKAKLIHVGDYDPVGLAEFLRVYKACGDRVTLYAPENMAYLFSTYGNQSLLRDKPKNQELLRKLKHSGHKDVLAILPLIERYGCVVEQEILLATPVDK